MPGRPRSWAAPAVSLPSTRPTRTAAPARRRLGELPDDQQVPPLLRSRPQPGERDHRPPGTEPRRPRHRREDRGGGGGGQVHAAGVERPAAAAERARACHVEDHVVAASGAGEVRPGVVDDGFGAQLADQPQYAGRCRPRSPSAPKCTASWTAAEPTAPDAPLTRTACPLRRPALSRRKHSAVASASAAASA